MSKNNIFLVSALIILAAASRLLDHPFNFTPIAAISIFAGCYMASRKAVLIPLAAMLASDFFLGFYNWQVMASVYIGIAAAFAIGRLLKKYMKWHTVLLSSVVSSTLFFIITNFAVWAFFPWYEHSLAGLIQCFTLALPFFKNSLLGDIFYTSVLFGAYEFVLAGKSAALLRSGLSRLTR